MGIVTRSALLLHAFVDRISENVFFTMAIETELPRFRDKEKGIPGTMRLVADLAATPREGPMNIFFL